MSPALIAVIVVVLAVVVTIIVWSARGKAEPAPPAGSSKRPANSGAAPAVPSKPASAKPAVPSKPASAKPKSAGPARAADTEAAPAPSAGQHSLYPNQPGEDVLDEEEPEGASGPHRLILVTAVGMTDPGLRRKHNEDAYVCLDEHNLYAIADGMGMHAAGEVASKVTIEAITEVFTQGLLFDDEDAKRAGRSRRKRLVRTIERANSMVLAMSREVEEYSGMGTTVVMAQFSPAKARVHIAHVGDSRCYRLRGNEIKQMTVDHTLGAVGIQGKTAGLLSRAVGIEKNIEVDVTVDHPEAGDVYLLCSDGLSRMTTDDKILQTVRESGNDLDEAARRLIALANAGGGRDNVTTILIRVDRAPGA